jgi:hypothetical protein
MTHLNLYAWSGKLPPPPLIGFGAKADEDDDGEMSVDGDTRSESVCRQQRSVRGQTQAHIRLDHEFLQTQTMSSYLNITMQTERCTSLYLPNPRYPESLQLGFRRSL